jgi:hypothetical protein
MDRERTDERLWFTRALNWRLDGRKLFARETILFAERRTDVRRVQTTEPEPVGGR